MFNISTGAAAAIMIAGSDTVSFALFETVFIYWLVQTLTTIIVFILMMMTNKEAQRKGQAEIDAAIGRDRLPEFADLEGLTYLNYIRQEVFR